MIETQHEIWPAIGGGQLSLYKCSKFLTKNGIQIKIFTTNQVDHVKNIKVEPGVFNDDGVTIIKNKAGRIGRYFVYDMFLFSNLMNEHCDLIHAHGYGYFHTEIAAMVAKIKKIPLVISTHGYFPIMMNMNKGLTSLYIGISKINSLRIADAILVDSEFERNLYSKVVDPNKIHILPMEVLNSDTVLKYKNTNEAFGEAFHNPFFLCVGRIIRDKGFQNVIRAIPTIVKETKNSNLKFIFMGPDGGFKDELIELAKVLGVTKNIVFYGKANEDEKFQALKHAVALILPSRVETYSAIVTEAMSMGSPVISTKYGGTSERLIHDFNGYLVDPESLQEISEAVDWALSLDKDTRETIAEHNYNFILNNYTVESTSKKLLSLYSEIIRG